MDVKHSVDRILTTGDLNIELNPPLVILIAGITMVGKSTFVKYLKDNIHRMNTLEKKAPPIASITT